MVSLADDFMWNINWHNDYEQWWSNSHWEWIEMLKPNDAGLHKIYAGL